MNPAVSRRRKPDAISVPVQHGLAWVKPLKQRFPGWVNNPVDGTEANLFQGMRRLAHSQLFNPSSGRHCQELCAQADSQNWFLPLMPVPQPVQFPLQPVHAWLQPVVHAHGTTQHQGDGVAACIWIREGITQRRAPQVDRHPAFPSQIGNQVGSLLLDVLDHQQGGAQSSR